MILRKRLLLLTTLIFSFLLGTLFSRVYTGSVSAGAEEAGVSIEGTVYRDLEEGLLNWTAGKTLTLLSDCEAGRITVSDEKTLDLNGYTLKGTESRTLQIEATGNLTLKSSAKGGSVTGGGVYLIGGANFTMEQNTRILECSAENGGGIYVDKGATLTLNSNAVISENRADVNGGGIYAAGTVNLSGSASVFENEGSNLYLTEEAVLHFSANFSGEVGVTATTGVFTSDKPANGNIVSDDPLYQVVEKPSGLALELCPLALIEAQMQPVVVYPTTKLEDLTQYLTVTGFNANGIEYPAKIDVTLSGELKIGESRITVSAKGQGGETVSTTLIVTVSLPKLDRIRVNFTQRETYYADFDVENLHGELIVTGYYSDGFSRRIFHTSELTKEQAQEDYISDYYVLSASPKIADRKAEIEIAVYSAEGETLFEDVFTVSLSRRTVYTSEIEVVEVKISEGSGEALSAYDFTPNLPSGVIPAIRLKGTTEPVNASQLAFGIYLVEVSFAPENQAECEVLGSSVQTRLLVYASEYRGEANGLEYVIRCEGGISPEWVFSFTKAEFSIERGYSKERAFELTFFPWESKEIPAEFTVTLLFDEPLSSSARLYRVVGDGKLEAVEFETDRQTLSFRVSELNQTRFVIATQSNDAVLIAVSVCFGVLTVAGAFLFLRYVLRKRRPKS